MSPQSTPTPAAQSKSKPALPAKAAPTPTERLFSLDAYRGAVMLLLAFFDGPNDDWRQPIAALHPDKPPVQALVAQFEHVEWAGLRLWDMIQPSFMFLVGTSLAFSCASRAARGQSSRRMFAHAVYRSIVLILLGVFLRSVGRPHTYWTFEDVVTQIGLGYVFLFLLWNRGWKVQLGAAAAILIGYWMLFAFWRLPGPDYGYAAVNGHAYYEGFQAHWNKNAHPAHYFDQWFLNLFPASKPPSDPQAAAAPWFVANAGGYNTLNFVPSLATMIFGLMAGELLRGASSTRRKLLWLFAGAVIGCGLGAAMHYGHVGPIVKRIWTPSFALFSSGICFAMLATLYAIIDVLRLRRWAFPAIVVGQNSIAMYVMIHLFAFWIVEALRRHFAFAGFHSGGVGYQPMLENFATGAILWLICYWMYRRRIFVHI